MRDWLNFRRLSADRRMFDPPTSNLTPCSGSLDSFKLCLCQWNSAIDAFLSEILEPMTWKELVQVPQCQAFCSQPFSSSLLFFFALFCEWRQISSSAVLPRSLMHGSAGSFTDWGQWLTHLVLPFGLRDTDAFLLSSFFSLLSLSLSKSGCLKFESVSVWAWNESRCWVFLSFFLVLVCCGCDYLREKYD